MDISSFIKDIGRSFIISSLLPALFFLTIATVLFGNIFPIDNDSFIISKEWLFVTAVIWIAFGLYSILPWTLRVFEGQFLPQWLKQWMISKIKKSRRGRSKRLEEVYNLKKELLELREKKQEPSISLLEKYRTLLPIATAEYVDLAIRGPIYKEESNEEALLSPTQFGNLMIAAMVYPQKYNMSGDIIWPRLQSLLPKNFRDDKDDAEARLIFLLNSSLLCYLLGTISMIAGLISWIWISWLSKIIYYPNWIPSAGFPLGVYWLKSPFHYVLLGLFFIWLGYMIYRLAVYAAENFVFFVWTGFDLYRFELLKQLKISLPDNNFEEQDVWGIINEFLATGYDLSLVPAIFEYLKKDDQPSDVDESPDVLRTSK